MKSIIKTLFALTALVSFAYAGAKVGTAAPDFTLTSADGKEVKLSDFKGKEVVLEWVNFDCPYVKKHYDEGHMQALQKTYTEKGAVWLLISSAHKDHATFKDSSALAATAKKKNASATHTLVDADGSVGKAYDAKTTPNMYVINKEGVLAYAGAIDSKKSTKTADIEGAENYVSLALDALMAGKEVATPKTKPYGCSVKYAK